MQEMNEGTLTKPDPRTLAEFLNQWLAEYATRKVAPKTLERYQDLARHVTRAIGSTLLTKVTTLQLQRVYNALLDSGKKDGTGLAVKTVRHVHGMVHGAFETALKWGLLKINPAHACDLPPVPQREARAMDQSETAQFMETCGDTWLRDVFETALSTGARRGEILALAWSDVDLETGILTIRKSLEETKQGLLIKETKGRKIRRLNLPESTVELLRGLREKQAEARRMFGFDTAPTSTLSSATPAATSSAQGRYRKPRVG